MRLEMKEMQEGDELLTTVSIIKNKIEILEEKKYFHSNYVKY